MPAGYFTLTPRLTVEDIDAAVEFYTKVFGAEALTAVHGPSGATVYAEIRIGDSIVMLEPEDAERGTKAPAALQGTPATLVLRLEDADGVFATALDAGAIARMPIEEQFWGDRYGELVDPFGHRWALATHVEDLTLEQIEARAVLAAELRPKRGRKSAGPPKWRSIAGTPASDPTPEPYHTITLALTTSDAAVAIELYKAAFGARERARISAGGDKIIRGELEIGDSILMLSDEFPERGESSPTTLGGSPVVVHMYVDDVFSTLAQAIKAGATLSEPIAKTFLGNRYGAVTDTSDFLWGVASRVEDLTVKQMEARLKAK